MDPSSAHRKPDAESSDSGQQEQPSSSAPPPSGEGSDASGSSPAPSRGRRAGRGIYLALMVALGAAITVQVSKQIFGAGSPAGPPPFSSCREGLEALYAAMERGRRAAEDPADAHLPATDEAALHRYRQALEPVWRYRDAVAELCRSDPQRQAALDAMDRLRYAEERRARNQPADLASLRRRVRQFVEHSRQSD